MNARYTLPLAVSLGLAAVAVAPTARAQSVALAPVVAPTGTPATVAPAPAGPALEAASVGARAHSNSALDVSAAAAPRRAGMGQPVALMAVGGAALLTGLIIGGDAGTVIAVSGVVIGLYGLYQFLQ